MKRFLRFAVFLLPISASAAPPVVEMPIVGAGTPQTISISTATWTKITSTTGGNLAGRTGVFIVNQSTNPSRLDFIYSASTPSDAIGEKSVELQPGEWDILPCSPGIDVYGISRHTAAQDAKAQEVKQ